MINDDRRSRGDNGDTAPHSVDQDIEDLLVVVEAAGRTVTLFGNTGGTFLAIRAVAGGIPGDRIAGYRLEARHRVDDRDMTNRQEPA